MLEVMCGCTYTTSIKDLDSHDIAPLGNTISLADDGTGDMSAMTISVNVGDTGVGIVAQEGSALELRVLSVDTSVDDIGPHLPAS